MQRVVTGDKPTDGRFAALLLREFIKNYVI